MTDPQDSSRKLSDVLGALEKLVSGQTLILFLSVVFYADLCAMSRSLDPRSISAAEIVHSTGATSIASLTLFALGFAFLMAALFPGVRLTVCCIRRDLFNNFPRSKNPRALEAKRVSDWCLGMLCLGLVDVAVGSFCTGDGQWHGIILYGGDVSEGHNFLRLVMGLSLIYFLVGSVGAALEHDW